MAVLGDTQREGASAEFMQDRSRARDGLALTKSDLRAAVTAIDQWVDANSASFNTTIPQPARNALTAKQKAQLLVFVVNKRWEVL